MSSAMVFETLF